jgi:hypothetical protein
MAPPHPHQLTEQVALILRVIARRGAGFPPRCLGGQPASGSTPVWPLLNVRSLFRHVITGGRGPEIGLHRRQAAGTLGVTGQESAMPAERKEG